MRCRTENVSHRMRAWLGMKVRGGAAGLAARAASTAPGERLLVPLFVRRPRTVPQSGRALGALSESVCCIDGVVRAPVSRKILFEERQGPTRPISRVARDLTKLRASDAEPSACANQQAVSSCDGRRCPLWPGQPPGSQVIVATCGRRMSCEQRRPCDLTLQPALRLRGRPGRRCRSRRRGASLSAQLL
jgi:hypothetical protein